jgi:NDP-sugar pyrophosphorylase family protein
MNNQVVILAGGLATRLRPITETIPKAMVEVEGKPFILHQLELLRRNGLTQFVICAGYLGEQIEQFLGDGSSFGLAVTYSYDGEQLLGTGGALKNASALLDDTFMVLYGDSYLDIDYKDIGNHFHKNNALSLMTVFQNADQWDKSNVIYDNGQVILYDKKHPTSKMKYIDYGLGMLRKTTLDLIPANTVYDLSDLYNLLSKQGQLLGYQVHQRFYEIGSFDGLEDMNHKIRQENGRITMDIKAYVETYLSETVEIARTIDHEAIVKAAEILKDIKTAEGRLFILGVGGSAGNASHAVNDFRKIGGIEAYAPTDNVSELTARVNDESWEEVFVNWLRVSKLNAKDGLLVFSVGGGSATASLNLARAMDLAKELDAKVISVVSRDGGHAKSVSDACVLVPVVSKERITPHAEGWQGVVWHLLVNAI